MQKSFFIILILFLGICSCSEDTDSLRGFDLNPGEVQFYYSETQCADPWYDEGETGQDSYSKRVDKVLHYLEEEGIEVLAINFSIDESNIIACLECHCLTGGVYYLKTKDDPDTIGKLEEIGFVLF